MHARKYLLATLALSLSCTVLPVGAQSSWHVEKTLQIGGVGAFDYITVNPATHRLYVPRTTHTLVIDAESGKTLADIPGQKAAHGVALVPMLNRGFITDGGGDGAIVIFDLKTNAVLGTLAAKPDADGIIYDPASNLVLVSAGDSNALIPIKADVDPKSGKIDAPIALGGAPEFLAADGAGKVYVNLEDKDNVAVVDLKARKVLAHWPVAPGGKPVGMSIDKAKHHLIIGCRGPQKMIVMSTENGKVVANLPIGAGVDATSVSDGEYFASCGDGTLAIVKETSGKFAVAETVKTLPVAKTLVIDPSTHKIYLPTADFDPPAAGSKGRGKAKPDSFKILVVSK
jgi:DNA-binding beta-propeller fold protein YncE